MTMIRKMIRAEITALGDDEVEVVMSTAALARDGHVLVPSGCDLTNYRANPIVLWSHNPDFPVGNAEDISVGSDKISARIRFAPSGISPKADEVRGLMKTGVLRAVSVGFEPIEMEPLDPKKPRGGQRIATWELLELSPVSVPADPGAVVTARANGETAMSIENRAGVGATTTRADTRTTSLRSASSIFTRGLYDVAQLCHVFCSLGYQLDSAKWEAAMEGDQSQVPAMLADVLADLGDVLLAMTAEEVAEALASYDILPEIDEETDLPIEERAHIKEGATPAIRSFRFGMARAKQNRAGKALSAESLRCMRASMDCHQEAIAMHRNAIRKHKEGLSGLETLISRADGASDDSTAAADDGNSTNKTGEDDDTSVSERSFDFRRRQADLLALEAQ